MEATSAVMVVAVVVLVVVFGVQISKKSGQNELSP
jgi:hypothetical protein